MKKLITILIGVPLLFVACQNDEVIPSNNEEINLDKFGKQNFLKIDVETQSEFHAKNAGSKQNSSFVN